MNPNPKIIFATRYDWHNTFPFFMENVFPNLTQECILITASEDCTFPNGDGDKRMIRSNIPNYHKYIDLLLNSKLIKHIFVENLDMIHPKLTPIPLGVCNYGCAGYGDGLYNSLIDFRPIDLTVRPINAFLCHYGNDRGGEQWDDRRRITEYAKKWSFVESHCETLLLPTDFKDKMLNSKFCICVHGGGIDPSPKCFQALLCGSIPIIQHSPLDEAYSRFPVVFVDEWTEDCLSEEMLAKHLSDLRIYYEDEVERKKVLNMLTLDYWFEIIRTKSL